MSGSPFALIVEDDVQVRNLLCRVLASEGFEISAATCCRDAKEIVKGQKPDIVLLDLGLPGGDGLELGAWIRGVAPSAGIIILSGRANVADRLAGLQGCADDYVTKPFDVQEVCARVHNLMKRRGATLQIAPVQGQELRFEGWLLSEDSCTLILDGREVKLTVMEFLLLKALVTCQGRVATRGWLLDQINADAEINERTVDYHICTLRIKLRKARLPEGIIASVRGVGYRYSAAPAALTGLST